MDKDVERNFLETLSRALVSLPFDVKVLLEGVSDPDLEHRRSGAGRRDRGPHHHPQGRQRRAVRPPRRGRDPAAAGAAQDRSPRAGRARRRSAIASPRTTAASTRSWGCSSRRSARHIIKWLDGKWPALRQGGLRAQEDLRCSSTTRRSGTFLYDEGLRFGTEYPITEKTLAGRLKQAQPVVDHLHRKWEQDKKKITQ